MLRIKKRCGRRQVFSSGHGPFPGVILFTSPALAATEYYVNAAAPAPGGAGTQADPWKTLSEAFAFLNGAGLAPGDHILHVLPGTYTIGSGSNELDQEHLLNPADGVNITIVGQGNPVLDPGGAPVNWKDGIQIFASNVTVSGLTIQNFTQNGIYIGANVRRRKANNNTISNVTINNVIRRGDLH